MSPRISIRLLAAQSDQRLVALAREGHERAFEALVHRYRRPLLRYARRMRLSEARAEDVLQQSFMQSWIALSRGARVRDVRAWLYRIVHNVAVNAMRGQAEAHGELTQAIQDGAGLAVVSNIERSVAMRDALGDVAALPRMQRQAIFLTAVDGQSHEQVAGALGITPGALRGLLYRARSTLRSAAAALTPPPVLVWACTGAGPSAPSAERLAELSAGGGGAAIAGLLFKGAAIAVTAGAVATGTSMLSVRHSGAGRPGVHSHAAQPTSAASGLRSLAAGPQLAAGALASPHEPASPHGRAHTGGRRGGHGRRGSSRRPEWRGTGSEERPGEQARLGGHDRFASDGGRGWRSNRSSEVERSGSTALQSGRRRESSQRDGGLQDSRSARHGSRHGGSDIAAAQLGDSGASLPDSPEPPSADLTSGPEQPLTSATEGEDAAGSSDRQSGKGGDYG